MYMPEHLRRKEANVMYRSNSSLDLIYAEHPSGNGLRREYGSHGSIDVIGNGERMNGMVQNGAASDRQPSRLAEVLATDHADGPTNRTNASPKQRLKLNKFWGGTNHSSSRQIIEDTLPETEQVKRKQFAHYDCQSLLVNLSYTAEARGALLSRRRNTTTGASAASLLASRGFPPGDDTLSDTGDGRTNELVESCPFFRNELGGEEERCVALCWRTSRGGIPGYAGTWHRPRAAYGLSVLEFPPGQTHWKHGCPFANTQALLPVESQDLGALYYRNYFYTQPHQNWFGMDENLGPVAISIKKERIELRRGNADSSAPASVLAWQYRLIIRTSELLTLRGSVLEEVLPVAKPSNNSATYNTKEVLEYVAPELQLNCLRMSAPSNGAEEQLLRLDEQCHTRHYKVGIMYCKAGQATEEEMYNNQEAGPAFVEFLQMLGQTVRLKDFDKYKAGLDNRSDSTGLYSVYTTHQNCEIMFHVSTMLPFTPNNRQQLLRKRHIGNDIVTIVFQEPGAAPFTPRNIRSQFQHVFLVVRAIDPCTDNTHYSIAVSRAKEVPIFGPPIKDGAVYAKGEAFTELLLSKVINGENAAIQSPKFSIMATRTRQEYLKDLAKNYVTATTLDAGQRFSIFSSLLMKGSSNNSSSGSLVPKPDISNNEVLLPGGLCYHVQIQDEGSGGNLLDCVMGISSDTVVFIEENTRQIALVFPTESLLGWCRSGSCVRVWFHRGECVCVWSPPAVVSRLAAVAPPLATELTELTIQRNQHHQLGFHVSGSGLVSGVESGGGAARAGVRRGARLLEVCRASTAALTHHSLLDLLKTADPLTVIVTFASYKRCECDVLSEDTVCLSRGDGQLPGRHRRYDHTQSPPSHSSGYGTGGSGSSGRSARQSPASDAVRRRSHDDSPRNRHKRASANTNSLTEELMRLMESELNPPAPPSGPGGWSRSLPLPDATALDWSALVHTATSAMLQICEEHQYPSMDNTEASIETSLNEPPTSDTWAEPPSEQSSSPVVTSTVPSCACGLSSRVQTLEADLTRSRAAQHTLEEEVRRLRRQNARLREESARAVWQLRHFTQWLKRTVDKQ